MNGSFVPADPETCPHPPRRLYLNAGRDGLGEFRIVSCCDCGRVLGDLRDLPRVKRAEIARHLGGDPLAPEMGGGRS